MASVNRIVKVELAMQADESWVVSVTKEFAPEYGGGSQVFTESVPASGWAHSGMHRALDVARGMVTLSPGSRTDVEVTL